MATSNIPMRLNFPEEVASCVGDGTAQVVSYKSSRPCIIISKTIASNGLYLESQFLPANTAGRLHLNGITNNSDTPYDVYFNGSGLFQGAIPTNFTLTVLKL